MHPSDRWPPAQAHNQGHQDRVDTLLPTSLQPAKICWVFSYETLPDTPFKSGSVVCIKRCSVAPLSWEGQPLYCQDYVPAFPGLGHSWVWEVAIAYTLLNTRSSHIYTNLEGHFGEGGSWVGGAPTNLPTPNHPQGHKHLTMQIEKGPEWDYVTLVQHESTDGVKQGKNKRFALEHVFHGGAARIRLHFLQVPGCGVAKCKAAEDTWVAMMRMRRGRRRGPAVMGRVGFQVKRRT
eukprot:1136133-Pelagomonas_calceolata.AAC.1